MEDLYIKGTDATPTIRFNVQTRVLDIEGESYIYDSRELYEPVLEWFERYLTQPGLDITVNLKIGFFNSSSYRNFAEILLMLAQYQKQHHTLLKINWSYKEGDLDAQYTAQDLSDTCGVKFNYITI